MRITYIGHSGFLVESETCYLLFDYYYGDLPELDAEKPVLVFGSHSHRDHYNPEVFEKLKKQRTVRAILSNDIFESRVPKELPCQFVKAWERISPLEGIWVETFRSTDKGVAFLVTADENVIYHGGDLNDWVWDEDSPQERGTMTGMYRKEIDKMKGKRIDLAFLPLDGRQKQYYDRGLAYFMHTVKPRYAVPMHFWNQPEMIGTFKQSYPQYADAVIALTKNGQSFAPSFQQKEGIGT